MNLYNFWDNTGFGNLPTCPNESIPGLGPQIPGPASNLPSLQTQLNNPLPLATASLLGGDSTSYRIIAGADFSSTLPDAFRSASQGDVVLNGHEDYQAIRPEGRPAADHRPHRHRQHRHRRRTGSAVSTIRSHRPASTPPGVRHDGTLYGQRRPFLSCAAEAPIPTWSSALRPIRRELAISP